MHGVEIKHNDLVAWAAQSTGFEPEYVIYLAQARSTGLHFLHATDVSEAIERPVTLDPKLLEVVRGLPKTMAVRSLLALYPEFGDYLSAADLQALIGQLTAAELAASCDA